MVDIGFDHRCLARHRDVIRHVNYDLANTRPHSTKTDWDVHQAQLQPVFAFDTKHASDC
jgi:hypothetical protein